MDAWEAKNLALGRPVNAEPESAPVRRRVGGGVGMGSRKFGGSLGMVAASATVVDEKERGLFVESAFSDAVAIYLLSLALDFEYGELKEREYPLLAPAALAARLKLVSELFPPNDGYEFAVKYRRRA
jgi:hypothetical protein